MMGMYSNRFYMEMDAVSENEAFARVYALPHSVQGLTLRLRR